MFDPIEFYKFSEEMLGFYNSKESARRSVVSRSYYAVFLIIREKLRKTHPDEVHDNALDHAGIAQALKKRGYDYEAQKCFDLKDERHEADYKLNNPCSDQKANDVLADARDMIENRIPNVSF